MSNKLIDTTTLGYFKISDFSEIASLSDDAEILIMQDGVTKRATAGVIRSRADAYYGG